MTESRHSILESTVEPTSNGEPSDAEASREGSSEPVRGRTIPRWVVGFGFVAAALAVSGVAAVISGNRGAHAQSENGSRPPPPAETNELSVNTVQPRSKTLVQTLEQPGSVRAWAQAELHAKTSGYVKRIARETSADGKPGPEKDLGSAVKAGEVLLEIDVPDLLQDVKLKESQAIQIEAELAKARTELAGFEATVAFHTKQLARIRELVKSKTVTEEYADEKDTELRVTNSKLANAQAEIRVKESRIRVAADELERARIVAEFGQIHAPFNGVITYRGVDTVGDFVQNATTGQPRPLFSIIAVDTVKVILQVPEKEAAWVHLGTEATIRLDAVRGVELKARVARVGPALDGQSRTRQVEIDVPNPGNKILPGMYAEVSLILQKIENAQAIPATAMYSRGGMNYIIEVVEGVAHRQRVRIRYDDGKEVEVLKLAGDKEVPLTGSEELIVSNKGEIAEGQRVRTSRVAPR